MSNSPGQLDENNSGNTMPADTQEPVSADRPAAQIPRAQLDLAALPKVIGRYHVIEKIGEGGMGIVLKAEQRTPVRRVVALKVIKLGLDSKSVLARFQAEQQALAVMDHAHIARVLDAGITEAGRAYFVMEYVPGEPITQYCDRQQLSVRQRLELFQDVCSAVQHAHTKGVIHRDLKPDNVLVSVKDGQPAVKVIDFGVAKAIQGRLAEQTYFTEHGQIIGTPEYMSPEQAEMNNLDIDTRTDIYGLGVMLYELLTGCLPFDSKTLRQAAYGEIQRMIREDVPPRPSTRLSSVGDAAASAIAQKRRTPLSQLTTLLHGELGWIPLKALRKDRIERYQTAGAMEQDILNYLQGRPLLAGPESAFYRAKKLFSRNKGVVLATAAIVVLLTGGVSLYVLEIRGEQRKTEQALQKAEKLAAEKTALADANAALAGEKDRLATVAVKARELSDANAARASASEKQAQLALAESLIAQGDALASADNWTDAKARYTQATEIYQRVGVSALRADLAMVAAYLHAPPPLCVMTQPTGHAENDPKVRAAFAVSGRDPSTSFGSLEAITTMAYSSDGRLALTGVRHAPANLWDAQLGRIVGEFDSDQAGDRAVAMTQDGKWALIGGSLGVVTLWDVKNRKVEKILKSAEPLCAITSVAISPDAKYGLSSATPIAPMVGGAANGTFARRVAPRLFQPYITFWDLSTGQPLQRFPSPERVFFLALSADNRRAISAAASTALWDLETGKEIPLPVSSTRFHSGALTFSLSGQMLAARELDDAPGMFRLFDDQSEKSISRFPIPTVTPGSFTTDGQVAIFGHQNNDVSVFDLSAGRERRVLTGHADFHLTSAITPDGRFAATAGWDATLRTWALAATPQIIHHESPRNFGGNARFSPDCRMVLGGADGSAFQLWDAATGKTLLVRDLRGAGAGCWSPDGSRVAFACEDGVVRIWDLKQQRELPAFGENGSKLSTVAFSPDGKWLATGGDDRRVRIFDVATASEHLSLPAMSDPVSQLAFSPDSSLLLAGGGSGDLVLRDTYLKLWNPRSGGLVRSFPSRGVYGMSFSPDGTSVIIATSFEGLVRMDIQTALQIGEKWRFGIASGVSGIAFSPDGSIIAASQEGGDYILTTADAQPLRTFKLPTISAMDHTCGVDFSRDQHSILLGSRILDLSWPTRYREMLPGVEKAFKTLQGHPDDGSALKAIGQWYALNAIWDWAAELLEKSRAVGAAVSPLMLAQCYWQLDRYEDARREYANALSATDDPKAKLYLQLCLNAVTHSAKSAEKRPPP